MWHLLSYRESESLLFSSSVLPPEGPFESSGLFGVGALGPLCDGESPAEELLAPPPWDEPPLPEELLPEELLPEEDPEELPGDEALPSPLSPGGCRSKS